MNGYRIDFATKTLTITKAFADAATNPNSDEYSLLTQFQKDFQGLRIVQRTHKSPKKANQFKNLTYERMERFMNALPESEEKTKVLESYQFLRYGAGSLQTNTYTTVRKWFEVQFPEYRSNPLFYLNHKVKIVDIAPFVGDHQQSA